MAGTESSTSRPERACPTAARAAWAQKRTASKHAGLCVDYRLIGGTHVLKITIVDRRLACLFVLGCDRVSGFMPYHAPEDKNNPGP